MGQTAICGQNKSDSAITATFSSSDIPQSSQRQRHRTSSRFTRDTTTGTAIDSHDTLIEALLSLVGVDAKVGDYGLKRKPY